MNKTTESQIKEILDTAAEQIQAVVTANLRSALFGLLNETPAPQKARAPHVNGVKPAVAPKVRPKLRPAGTRRKREDVQVQAARLLTWINSNPGQRAEQLAAGTGIPTSEIPLAIKLLKKEKKVKAKGVARGTTYTAVEA